jgi:hypothetical protein
LEVSEYGPNDRVSPEAANKQEDAMRQNMESSIMKTTACMIMSAAVLAVGVAVGFSGEAWAQNVIPVGPPRVIDLVPTNDFEFVQSGRVQIINNWNCTENGCFPYLHYTLHGLRQADIWASETGNPYGTMVYAVCVSSNQVDWTQIQTFNVPVTYNVPPGGTTFFQSGVFMDDDRALLLTDPLYIEIRVQACAPSGPILIFEGEG